MTIFRFSCIIRDRKEVRAVTKNKAETEVNNMTNEQTQILLEAIKIIAEKSQTKDEFLKELGKLQEIRKPQ